jgi:hypothetical protein
MNWPYMTTVMTLGEETNILSYTFVLVFIKITIYLSLKVKKSVLR